MHDLSASAISLCSSDSARHTPCHCHRTSAVEHAPQHTDHLRHCGRAGCCCCAARGRRRAAAAQAPRHCRCRQPPCRRLPDQKSRGASSRCHPGACRRCLWCRCRCPPAPYATWAISFATAASTTEGRVYMLPAAFLTPSLICFLACWRAHAEVPAAAAWPQPPMLPRVVFHSHCRRSTAGCQLHCFVVSTMCTLLGY